MSDFCSDEMKTDPRLAGGRCVGQIRCSRKEQAKKSLPQQQAWLRVFAEKNSMAYMADMTEAVSATQTRRRPDLDRIFERKATINDFDTVVVQDLSRLTRGGASHGLEVYFKFKASGIRLVSIIDGLIDGDEKIIEAARRFQEARAAAKATALNVRRGVLASREKGRIAYTFNVPFAVDRMITNESGVPLFRLRRMSDGSQQKLSPDGSVLLYTYPPNLGERRHHMKQPDEFETLVPGDPRHVDLVNRIYREFFVERRNANAIAKRLNDEGIPCQRAGLWSPVGIRYLVRNPVYLNSATSDRTAKGSFYKNGPSHPIPVRREAGVLSEYRPENEWFCRTYDGMEKFLTFDEATRASIRSWQMEDWRRKAAHQPKRRGGNRHRGSEYILTGVLTEKTTGARLRGHLSRNYRYYVLSRGRCKPKTGNLLARAFSADALEAPVRKFLKEILDGYPGVVSVAESAATSYTASKQSTATELPALRADRDKLIAQIDFWVSQLSDLGADQVAIKTMSLKERVVELGRRIESLQKENDTALAHSAPNGRRLLNVLRDIATGWDGLPNEAVKAVVQLLVGRMSIDFESGEVELEFRLPSWAAANPAHLEACLEKEISRCTSFETYTVWSAQLGKHRFLYRPMTKGGMIPLPPEGDRAVA